MFKRHPVDNPTITYGFGAGGDAWGANKHLGVDYGGYEGQPIYAPADGTVVWARGEKAAYGNPWEQIPDSGNNGNCIILDHGPENWATHTLYAHLSGFNVTEGQRVAAGQIIGYMGNTGYSFGTHLHWEMFIDYAEGVYPVNTFYGRVNPLDYFDVATSVPVIPGASGGTSTTKEDTLSAAEVKQITDHISAEATRTREYIGQILVSGYTIGGQSFPGSTKVDIENQRRINALTAIVTQSLAKPGLTAEDIKAAVDESLKNGVVTVDVNVNNKELQA